MTLNKPLRMAAWLAASLLITSTAAASVIWNEQAPGAGSLVATAQITLDSAINPLSGINGTLNAVNPVLGSAFYEVDMYRIGISNFNTFSARSVSSNPDDTSLFLFNSLGLGVYMNDDTTTDLLAFLTAGNALGPTSNGIFYLAVALGGTEAFDDIGVASFLAGGFTDIRGGNAAAGAIGLWTPMFNSGTELLDYSILLTGAVVAGIPEPATIALVLFALAGVAASRRSVHGARG